MQPAYIFFNDAGRLRSGWRLAIFTLLFWIATTILIGVTVLALAVTLGQNIQDVMSGKWGLVAQAFVLLLASVTIGGACLKLLESLPLKALGVGFHRGWFRDWLTGSLVGAVSLLFATGLASLAGGFRFALAERQMFSSVGNTLLFSCLLFIFAAAAEEALFRGYPLQTLMRAKLVWVGIILTSIAFALVHQGNPNLDAPGVLPGLAFANTALAGVWLAVIYVRTRSLWLPLGAHWAWNWMMAAVLGLPVSGIKELTPTPLLRATDLGPAWLTGGAYGIEAGAACTVALTLSTLFIWRTKFLKADEELLALTSHEIPTQAKEAMPYPPVYPVYSNQPPTPETKLAADEESS